MTKGGIYMYPYSTKNKHGNKVAIRLKRILDILPTEIDQRVLFFCGSTEMVEKLESFLLKEKTE